jgi:hypothetical protein
MFKTDGYEYRHRITFVAVSFVALVAGLSVTTVPLHAQNGERPVLSKKKAPAASWPVNLFNILVQQGLLTEEQAAALVKQAEDEMYVAREAARDATVKADEAAKAASAAAAAASPSDSKFVSYVPDIVKRQIREDLRREVMTQAQREGWASPGKYPEWASRIRLYGDFRARWEGIRHPDPGGFNDDKGGIIDYNAINTGSPYDLSDITNPDFAPSYNTTQNRNRARLRARLGLDADLFEGFTAGFRIGTGSDNSPVSTNQTLGGSGGNFSKYALWLDRAFVRYEPFKSPWLTTVKDAPTITLTGGRFDNPFWAPTDLMWDNDLGFDGIAVQARQEVVSGFTPFVVAGAFPIFNTSLDFSSTEPAKFKSQDKYLFGGQLGFHWQADPQIAVTLAAGIFEFNNVQRRLSSPCNVLVLANCDTDHLRPSFAQKGNSYSILRDIIPADQQNPEANQLQYFGLVSKFRPLVASGRWDFAHFAPTHIVLDVEYIWNTMFNKTLMERLAINNRGPDVGEDPGPFEGGNMGWLARITVGHTKLTQFGDWNVHVGYKYLESDATLDAFVDSDFGLGGTNLKGYFLGANVGLAQNIFATARWMSASSIAGPPYAVDIVQVDLNAKF